MLNVLQVLLHKVYKMKLQ